MCGRCADACRKALPSKWASSAGLKPQCRRKTSEVVNSADYLFFPFFGALLRNVASQHAPTAGRVAGRLLSSDVCIAPLLA